MNKFKQKQRTYVLISQGCKGDVWLPLTKDSTRDATGKITDVSTFEKLYSIETSLTEKKIIMDLVYQA